MSKKMSEKWSKNCPKPLRRQIFDIICTFSLHGQCFYLVTLSNACPSQGCENSLKHPGVVPGVWTLAVQEPLNNPLKGSRTSRRRVSEACPTAPVSHAHLCRSQGSNELNLRRTAAEAASANKKKQVHGFFRKEFKSIPSRFPQLFSTRVYTSARSPPHLHKPLFRGGGGGCGLVVGR